jgi:apolipoprotein N-acyltransferase
LICFDSIYEQLTLDSVRDGAEIMVISSNDSWFFDSAAVYQHQAQAQLRAIESGRYVLRSANTGISTIIAPNGEILSWIDPLTEGYAVCQVSTLSRNTPYTVVGNLFVFLSMAFCAGLFGVGVALKKRTKQ